MGTEPQIIDSNPAPSETSEPLSPQNTQIKPTSGRGKNPNSLANLRPWPKGVSGNPKGYRSKIPGAMERLARKKKEADKLALAQFRMAQDPENPRSVSAAQLILDRVEGPVTQRIETASVSLNISVSEQESALATLALLRSTTEGRED